jgi:hypothetical protein
LSVIQPPMMGPNIGAMMITMAHKAMAMPRRSNG